jgi:hypothetical protein
MTEISTKIFLRVSENQENYRSVQVKEKHVSVKDKTENLFQLYS